MRTNHRSALISFLLSCAGLLILSLSAGLEAAEPAEKLTLISRPDAFETLDHPNCSHLVVEGKRRKDLRADDRVLCWMQVSVDGYVNDGAIPFRFFLNRYRVVMDSWGLFVYDADAGFARGFNPAGGPYRFHGWRNGVLVFKGPDGTLYSALTGIAFDGPKKGARLELRPTLVSDWGYWNERYPQAVAYMMYDQFKPVEVPAEVNADSRKSRQPADPRLPADTAVLGVWDGREARAYPIEVLKKAGVIQEIVGGIPRLVLWYDRTTTAAAYSQPFGTSGLQGDYGWIFGLDTAGDESAPFVDQRLGLHWDITGRPTRSGPRLSWMDSVQVKWFAWAAEHPQTSIYEEPAEEKGAAGKTSTQKGTAEKGGGEKAPAGKSGAEKEPKEKSPAGKESAAVDSKPQDDEPLEFAGPLGNLDIASRRFGILVGTDPKQQRVSVLFDGETDPSDWSLSPGSDVWFSGWWGRLDQFTPGDRVWLWFETDGDKHPVSVSLLADELSEQDLYGPVTVKEVNASAAGAPATATLETMRDKKMTARTVQLTNTGFYRGGAKVPTEELKVGEQVHVQSTGVAARLILDQAGFEKRRAEQQIALRSRWNIAGLPGTLILSFPERGQVELLLDHEAMQWGRALKAGDEVILQSATPISAVVRRVRPWRERTKVLLATNDTDLSAFTTGQRVMLRLTHPPAIADATLPAGLGISRSKPERLEWLISSLYCTCGMHDGCAGQPFTLAACDSVGKTPCGLAKHTREQIAGLIDEGLTDRQIVDELLEKRGPNLLRPHMSP